MFSILVWQRWFDKPLSEVWREATLDWTKSLCSLFLSPDEEEQAVAELSTAKASFQLEE